MVSMRSIIISVFVILLTAVVIASSGCDSTQTYHPQFIINVNIDEATYPVDSGHKLYAVFYVNADFDVPWMTVSSARTQIVTPELNIGDYPLLFEVWYDVDGSGDLTTDDIYAGWKQKNDRTTDTLDPLPTSDTEIMMLNFDMTTFGTY
jgi:hypothetical protein